MIYVIVCGIAVIVFILALSQSVAKAFVDATIDDPVIHPGTPDDLWHKVGRVDMLLDALAWVLVGFLSLAHLIDLTYAVAISAFVGISAGLLGRSAFRITVKKFAPKDHENWYGGDK